MAFWIVPALVAALGGALAVPAAAQTAAPFTRADVRYSYFGIGDTPRVEKSSGPIGGGAPASASLHDVFTQTITDSSAVPSNTYVNTADIELSASGSFSRLHARAAATLTSQENPAYVGDGASNGGLLFSSADVRFTDSITVTGPLAAGTAVQLTAWVYLDAMVASTQSGICGFEGYVPASAGASLRVQSRGVFLSASRSFCDNSPMASETFEATIGEAFEIEGSVSASNYINSSSDVPGLHSVMGLADASHTGYFFFTSGTQGVGVQALSGADYSHPGIAMVPEPGEWAMLLAGLAIVMGAVRRRRLAADGQGATLAPRRSQWRLGDACLSAPSLVATWQQGDQRTRAANVEQAFGKYLKRGIFSARGGLPAAQARLP